MRHPRLLILFALLSAVAQAQWLNFLTPGTPHTPDGKPNLTAPAPRTADGKPDLTGVWMHETTTVVEVKRLFGNSLGHREIDEGSSVMPSGHRKEAGFRSNRRLSPGRGGN